MSGSLFLLLNKLQALEHLHLGNINLTSAEGFIALMMGTDSKLKELAVHDLGLPLLWQVYLMAGFLDCWELAALGLTIADEASLMHMDSSSAFVAILKMLKMYVLENTRGSAVRFEGKKGGLCRLLQK